MFPAAAAIEQLVSVLKLFFLLLVRRNRKEINFPASKLQAKPFSFLFFSFLLLPYLFCLTLKFCSRKRGKIFFIGGLHLSNHCTHRARHKSKIKAGSRATRVVAILPDIYASVCACVWPVGHTWQEIKKKNSKMHVAQHQHSSLESCKFVWN